MLHYQNFEGIFFVIYSWERGIIKKKGLRDIKREHKETKKQRKKKDSEKRDTSEYLEARAII